ncbi:hypothetical protein DPMN_126505 [Dreissena polymorpha]|uniref:C2H2-type domain-containing protein n=1 Tax=Dreissena polymorpha TaxID=45954 RepID=A0A9D4GW80_DREPO|nr:hypothetical protein DPMN_126505 [Dreissena polymorpha]
MYKCEVCGYACNDKGRLKRHARTHTGERVHVYKCEVCGYACSQSESLKKP